ncbi:MAG: electron transfer flavoprotein subunit alpha/FixB family protein [Desulfobacteraceae bacterium]|jgi:electron transfer flavoprotein alpha subunit|nr:MAG: electron transfer flavoprotein subunit alpha/FixB family protein [Desulfobacteraceae bacterium]
MHQRIWVFVQHRGGAIEEATLGLIGEARQLISKLGGEGVITAVTLGFDLEKILESLGAYGIDEVLYIESESLNHYHGEIFAKVLFKLAKNHRPSCILMSQSSETADLSPRLAALMETGLVTRAMDFKIQESGKALAVRPVANGYLFEEIHFDCDSPPIVSFLPSVLTAPEPNMMGKVDVITEPMDESLDDLKTKVMKIIEAEPTELDLEEAEIIIAGGRGLGKDEDFEIIHNLAGFIGGSVAGTRPVIDWQTLPFERQIGQTGKTVTPRLIFVCGISGANEFTAGMEKSQLVIAINTDPHARIFRFAELGIIGDVHEILPLLITRLKELKESG